jgi:flagellar biosynthesis/type III secretory pathway protein FliH
MNIISAIKKNVKEIDNHIARSKSLDHLIDDLAKAFETELEERTDEVWREGIKQGYDNGLKDGFKQGVEKTLGSLAGKEFAAETIEIMKKLPKESK